MKKYESTLVSTGIFTIIVILAYVRRKEAERSRLISPYQGSYEKYYYRRKMITGTPGGDIWHCMIFIGIYNGYD